MTQLHALPDELRLVELGGLWVHPSVPALFQHRVAAAPHHEVAFLREAGRWRGVTLTHSAERVRRVAQGLLALGVERGDRVAIVSATRPEWGLVDLAILHLGAVTVGVYPTLPADEVAYQLEHAGAAVAVVEDAAQADKLTAARSRLPDLREVVTIDPCHAHPSLADLEVKGEALEGGRARFDAAWREVEPGDLATVIYTSGTTGRPKGAILTHGNLTYTVHAAARVLPHSPQDTSVVFLPQAHALQRVASYGGLLTGARAYFARSYAALMDDIREVEPTVQVSVPRLWEKLYAKLHEVLAQAPAHRRRVFEWGLAVGRAAAPYRKAGRPLPVGLAARPALARRRVPAPLKARVFGRNVRYLTSGGAPIDPEVLEFFYALGLLILEGWGLTETAAPATLNLPGAFAFGTVGRPLEGTEVRVADDGELLVRGPGVFAGYYRDEEATAAAFTEDGFFRTGDIGEVDPRGFVRITDRKKDLIVLSNGKNVAPQKVENHLKTIPLLGNCLVHGDRRSYLVGLLTLDPDAAFAWGKERGKVPAAADPSDDEAARPVLERLAADPDLVAAVDAAVRERNAALPSFEQLKAWRLLGEVWAPEEGSLTPTLKLKRRVIAARHADLLEALYRRPD